MRKFIIVAPLSALSRRTRLLKLANYLVSKGIPIKHYAWERVQGESVEQHIRTTIDKTILLRGGGYASMKNRLMYIPWMFLVFFHALSFKREDVVWALGFESAFPCACASSLKGFRVYFDDADRFSMIFSFPAPLRSLLETLEKWTSYKVHRHIIPGMSRYEFSSPTFFELLNFPSRAEVAAARELYAQRTWPLARLMINVNGSLQSGRGMAVLLDVAKQMKEQDVGFIVAGKLDCDEVKKLVQLPTVHYLGEISNSEAIASYFASDLVFTYYGPQYSINTFAQSNKWGDAIMTGIGIIVNSEVRTAEAMVQRGACKTFQYHDAQALVDWLVKIITNNAELRSIKQAIALLSVEHGFFEEQLDKLFFDKFD